MSWIRNSDFGVNFCPPGSGSSQPKSMDPDLHKKNLDLHQSEKLDLDPLQGDESDPNPYKVKNQIRIRIKVKDQIRDPH